MKRVLPFVLVVISFPVGSRAQKPPVYNDSDAYTVYAVIIADEWPVQVAKARRLVIQSETEDYPPIGGEKRQLCLKPAAGEEATLGPLIKAYEEANRQTQLLQRKLELSYEYELVPRETIRALFKGNGLEGWKDFYAKYPNSGGDIQLSAVGFNSDKTLALVYVGHSCGGLCGGGSYHLLKRTDDKWSEIPWRGESCSWAS